MSGGAFVYLRMPFYGFAAFSRSSETLDYSHPVYYATKTILLMSISLYIALRT